MTGCSAINCSNSSRTNFRLFVFPTSAERRAKWIQNTRRYKWTPPKNARLCEIHFEESQFEQNRKDGWKKLKPNAIPTLFSVSNSPPIINPPLRKSVYKIFQEEQLSNNEEGKHTGQDSDKQNEDANEKQVLSSDVQNVQAGDVIVSTLPLIEEGDIKQEIEETDEDFGEEGMTEYPVPIPFSDIKKEHEEGEEELNFGKSTQKTEVVGDVIVSTLPLIEEDAIKKELEKIEDDEEFAEKEGDMSNNAVGEHEGEVGTSPSDSALGDQNEDIIENLVVSSDAQNVQLGPHACDKCQKLFKHRKELTVHQRTQHFVGKGPFSCTECQKSFSQRNYLTNHQRSHSGPHPCPVCNKSFERMKYLIQHKQRIHSDVQKEYKCTLCNKSFNSKNTLVVHRRIHTGERSFSCSDCSKSFSTSSNLNKHKLTHTGERPYPCSDCNKSFRSRNNLKDHQRTHTGEQPFSCVYCHKTFNKSSNLTQHQRIHTGERHFTCSDCNRSFTEKGHLIAHLRTHTGE